ncbi:MAG TPA: hypothetical protein VK399_17265, partial [Longimicrobiaceae bacterium]|nr:hypothetical protein [Longimicrobiaceae bacterium]
LACTIHAGEGAGADSVRDAVHGCGCDRVGHGTRIIEDRSLLDYINDRRICVECCLTSNVQTRAVADFASHPVRQYYDAGIIVSLNTDNRLMSATTVTEEYWRAHRYLGFTWEELVDLSLMGFDSAFMHRPAKLAMIEKVRAEIAELEAAEAVAA